MMLKPSSLSLMRQPQPTSHASSGHLCAGKRWRISARIPNEVIVCDILPSKPCDELKGFVEAVAIMGRAVCSARGASYLPERADCQLIAHALRYCSWEQK